MLLTIFGCDQNASLLRYVIMLSVSFSDTIKQLKMSGKLCVCVNVQSTEFGLLSSLYSKGFDTAIF